MSYPKIYRIRASNELKKVKPPFPSLLSPNLASTISGFYEDMNDPERYTRDTDEGKFYLMVKKLRILSTTVHRDQKRIIKIEWKQFILIFSLIQLQRQ